MSLEFIGHTGSREGAEPIAASGPIIFEPLLGGSLVTWPDRDRIAAAETVSYGSWHR